MPVATHMQQQVLDAVAAVLAAANTSASTRVFKDRVDQLKPAQLPALIVNEGENGEDSVPGTISGLEERTLEVVIDCAVEQSSTAAADARALGLAVEKAVRPAASLIALCKRGRRISNSRLVLHGEGADLFASRRQTWQFTYLVKAASPDAPA
jgi:hypothetical protein